jgi:hypothetical protein
MDGATMDRSPQLLALFGFNVSGVVNAVLTAVVRWIGTGAGALLGLFGHALNASTGVTFGSGFMAEYAILRSFGAELIGAFFCVVVIQAILRQDFGLLSRTVILRLPAALLLSGIALEVVSVLVKTSDVLSAAFLKTTGASFVNLVAGMAAVVSGPAIASKVISGFLGFMLASVLAVVVLLCWLELVVRAAAITVASLFIPLALAGLIWPATQRWILRLSETLFALVMSKVVIAAIFALAITSIGSPSGANMVLEGIALFILCAWSPFSLLRLIPFIEAGAVGHFETLGHRGGQALRHLSSGVGPIVGEYLFPPEPEGVEKVDGIEWAPSEKGLHFEIDPDDVEDFRFLEPWIKVRDDSSRERNQDGSFKRSPLSHVYEPNEDDGAKQ